MKIPKGGNQKP